MTYLYPYRRGTGWRSQGFRSNRGKGANGAGGHTGFDQAMAAGQPLYAPADGIIRNSGWLSDNYRDNGWWLTRMGGDTLVIDIVDAFRKSSGLPTFIFAHCADTMAEVGQFVRKGELVARSGNTGTATTGAHVHIEALPPNWDFNNGVYGRVDPELYFDEWIDDYAQAGIAAMGDYIKQQEEPVAFTPEQEEFIIKALESLVENVATKKDVATAEQLEFTEQALRSLVHNVATKADLVGVSAAVASAVGAEATTEEIEAAVRAGMAAGLKVDVVVGAGK